MNASAEVRPFYFGAPGKELFGCLHVPELEGCLDCGVVVCQPFGHEYVNSHRALRQLATRLVDAGFPVLRFDYYGCGDSRGETTESSLSEWIGNISQAICELQQRIAVSKICLIGLRLGASLAFLNAQQARCATSVVLWDPVIRGDAYLTELIALQKEMLRFRPKPRGSQRMRYPLDIFGFPLSEGFCRSIGEIDLLQTPRKVAEHVLLVETQAGEESQQLRGILANTGTFVDHQCLEAPNIWLPTEDGSLLVPGRVLQSITSRLVERHA
jgi:pimeloyl-ACP methyl ester carboxylesterase